VVGYNGEDYLALYPPPADLYLHIIGK